MKKIYLYDTTLRDGSQAEEISLSVMDKIAITEKLDDFGIHFIEGGYPGSNPKDKEFFEYAKRLRLKNAKLCAFGMTRRVGKKVEEDANMKALLSAETPVITVVGKSWDFHVTEALRTTLDENLKAIRDTVEFLKKHAVQVFFDAEHFFDGYQRNHKYALKALAAAAPANGRVVRPGPRVLQLSNPLVTGPDVKEAQQLLLQNPFGAFDPGTPDGEYGELTANAVKRAKWELGFPATAGNAVFGPQLKAFLSGTKPLPAAFQARRAKRLQQAGSEDAIRKRIVQWALWGCQNTGQIAYSQNGNVRLAQLGKNASLPLATDCSGFATLCYAWAGAPNPNAAGAYDARAPAYTGSMLGRMRKIPKGAAQAGDLVIWLPPAQGQHVCVVVQPGADPLLVSHGDDSGPKKLRFSAEDAYQRKHGHGTAVWLSVF
jgi:peptidoglycan hydrolase-like protein with peptidoglycan-binding domain